MNTITIGQQHYRWELKVFNWLNVVECTIYNIIDPTECLVIIQKGTDSATCTPQQIKVWIDFALQQGWYSETRVYQLFEINGHIRMVKLSYSLTKEAAVVKQLSNKFNKTTTGLEKSTIKYQFKNLENKIGLILPSIVKQLYLSLGNGDFGPDYGFFLLAEDPKIDKLTIAQAYQDIHTAKIKDWDWELSKLLVPFLYWGADIYSLVDCASPDGAIYVLDKNLKKENSTWQSCVWKHHSTMLEWLEKWSEGDVSGRALWLEMYQIKGLL
ncbi:SMI1/KNR4 family protein [Aureispira anguillae]|uniref:SMI1/KNR4 family protein n=1 Tax=Aureispira anguillae TaxID=2864201 RepID=A0A915YH01_9BACT|nr:SMI1/KNR4 family protein [Aureispira anguillae]BDS12862.1 SMI1/KNR4 family protein [Aureispira anguillae]